MSKEWNEISSFEDLQEIDQISNDQTVIIFKHSIRCSTSAMVLNRLERSWEEDELSKSRLFYLDLINKRDLSNEIALKYNIEHQSPQVLLIHREKCIHNASHFDVDFKSIKNKVLKTEDFSAKVS